MGNNYQIFIGKKEFLIYPNYNSEFIKNRLNEREKLTNIFYGLRITQCLSDTFYGTYKFGKGFATKLEGKINENNLIIICKPSVIMFILPVSIFALTVTALLFLTYSYNNKNISASVFLISLGLYFFFIILLYSIHRISIMKLLKVIGGGEIK